MTPGVRAAIHSSASGAAKGGDLRLMPDRRAAQEETMAKGIGRLSQFIVFTFTALVLAEATWADPGTPDK